MKNLTNIIKILTLSSLMFVQGCDVEYRSGKAVGEYYDYQAYVISAVNDDNIAMSGSKWCDEDIYSPYLEPPSYCEQFPGLECCTWEDNRTDSICEIEWCRWQDECEWEYQEMLCY